MNRILVVEDDPTIGQQVIDYLGKNGFRVRLCNSFSSANQAKLNEFDLVILDWNLGDGEGVDLLKGWRTKGERIPVILLTARADVIDRVVGLELGAQDYVVKPYDPRELLARVRVHLRGSQAAEESVRLSVGELELDLTARECLCDGTSVELTKMEFDLLQVLMRGAGKVFTRDELLYRVWGMDTSAETRTVDAHVAKLRQKLGQSESTSRLETVRGLGYRLRKDK